jgi:predicted O-methyltransferase YrrM
MRRILFHLARRLSNRLFGPELTHRSALARALFGGLAAVARAFSPAHRRQRAFERANPDAPWLVPDSIPAIEALLARGQQAFEWGAGRSTLWLARQGVKVTSVEGRSAWHEEVRRRVLASGLGDRVELKLVEVERDYEVPAATVERYAGAVDALPDRSLDLVLVDGHFRAPCVARALPKLKPGGHLVIDNADIADLAESVAKLAPWRIGLYDNGVWQTMVFRAPSGGFSASG